jgi:hypothetical protein
LQGLQNEINQEKHTTRQLTNQVNLFMTVSHRRQVEELYNEVENKTRYANALFQEISAHLEKITILSAKNSEVTYFRLSC